MPTASRKVRVKVSGAPVAFTTEATTNAGDNLNYQITNAAKRVWDRSATISVFKDAVLQSDTLYTVNRLSGRITFLASQGASVITVSGSYLPMSLAAEAKMVALSFIAENEDESTFEDDDVVRMQVQRDCSGRLGRWEIDEYFRDALVAGDPVVLELFLDGAGIVPKAKIWAILNSAETTGAQRALQEEEVAFEGAADVDGRSFTFRV
jgi:hypothetical protein